MNGREIIKAIMEQRDISNIEYARELGITRERIYLCQCYPQWLRYWGIRS